MPARRDWAERGESEGSGSHTPLQNNPFGPLHPSACSSYDVRLSGAMRGLHPLDPHCWTHPGLILRSFQPGVARYPSIGGSCFLCVWGVSISRSPDLLISPATHPATPPLTRHTKRLSRRAATLPFIYTTHPFASKPEMPLSCTHNAKHDVPLNVGPKQLNRQTGQSIGPERHPKIENHSHSRNDIVTPPVPAGLKGHGHSSVQRRDTHIHPPRCTLRPFDPSR